MSAAQMKTVYPCPLCGRTLNRRARPFTEPGQTAAHINGGHDEKHRGERGDDHLEEIRENGRQLSEAEIAEEQEDAVLDTPTGDDEEGRVPEAEEITVRVHGEKTDLSRALPYLGAYAKETSGQVHENSDDLDDLQEEVSELRDRLERLQAAADVYELPCGHEFENGEKLREARGDYQTVTCGTCKNGYAIDTVIED